jgi:hypothetical protein
MAVDFRAFLAGAGLRDDADDLRVTRGTALLLSFSL